MNNDQTIKPRLISVKQIETTLATGHTKVAELIRTGEIQTLKIGNRRFTTPDLLDDFINRKLAEQAVA